MRLFSILLLLIFVLPAQAQVYRWVDADGVVHYTDKPPNKTAKPVTLPPLQTYKPGPTGETPASPASVEAVAPAHPPKPVAPSIVSPKSKATIRDAQHRVSVEVNAALTPGQGLLYYLDGQPQNGTPTQATHFELSGVERGTHTLSVAIVDADGKPLVTSKPLTIYMKPPRVHRHH